MNNRTGGKKAMAKGNLLSVTELHQIQLSPCLHRRTEDERITRVFHDTKLRSQIEKNMKATFLALDEGIKQLISQINEPN